MFIFTFFSVPESQSPGLNAMSSQDRSELTEEYVNQQGVRFTSSDPVGESNILFSK